ncbi:hypothetical protein, partial [Chryseobacterium indoltheticum]|uniref:hypothetical protein n=1 Tax=Chryseobacterium indoltheticum TaxID=254 RepID=UPI003F493141
VLRSVIGGRCLTQVERSRIGVFAFIVKRFRVFRAPLHSGFDILSPIFLCSFYLFPRSVQDILNKCRYYGSLDKIH